MLHERTLFFDKALIAALDSVEQIVILGAGYDTRLFEFCSNRELALFEVDQIETQQVKRQALAKSNIHCHEVTFVAVDFAQEDWMQALTAAGFTPGKRTFFLWEGVTYYLTEPTVKAALSLMSEFSSAGSAVAFDFLSKALVKGESLSAFGLAPATAILNWIGEPLQFGIGSETNRRMNKEETRTAIEALLSATDFNLRDLRVVDNWIDDPYRLASSNVLGGLAIAQKPPARNNNP
jgi:methyltransferase (TIGR00027 family)